MTYPSGIDVAVYQVLDEAMTLDVPPLGARAKIHSIIDDLQRASAPHAMIARVESISIQLHCLEWAAARKDRQATSVAHKELSSIAAAWLSHRVGRA